MKNFKNPFIELGNINLFDSNDDFDVVKIDVISDDLQKINTALKELPNQTTFPVYEPHLTIAFIKKGTGDKYRFNITVPNIIELSDIIYSMLNGNKTKIDLQ